MAKVIKELGRTLRPCPVFRFPKYNEYIQASDPRKEEKQEFSLLIWGEAFVEKDKVAAI